MFDSRYRKKYAKFYRNLFLPEKQPDRHAAEIESFP